MRGKMKTMKSPLTPYRSLIKYNRRGKQIIKFEKFYYENYNIKNGKA